MNNNDLSYYWKGVHSYCCENCDYRWKIGCNLEEEVISLEYEDSFDYNEGLICPMCGSRDVNEL